MFRIKTDVRQYTCETRDKVVRLIRNWVIRPNDEIYNEDEQTWEPIGEHDLFVSTFREMEKAEEGVAETVVSPDIEEEDEASAPEVDQDGSPEDGSDGETSDPDEATEVTGSEQPYQADETDGDQEASDDQLEPPTVPEGVTTGREQTDSDEITVMTEETLDTVLEDDQQDGDIQAANAPSADPRDDLQTDMVDAEVSTSEEPSSDAEGVEPDEPTEPQAQQPSGEAYDESDRTDDEAVLSLDGREVTESESDAVDEAESNAVTSREDLPEEVFATNRMESHPDGDDSTAESEESTAASAEDAGESDEQEWDEILQRLRDTDELDGEEIDQIAESRDDLAISRDDPASDETTDQTEDYYGASGGYDWELPGYVAPTPADREHGLHAEAVTEADKDAVFPYPGPKQKDNVQTRSFNLGADSERDQASVAYKAEIVRILAIVFVIAVILVMLLSL
jgi:pilus assembly protein FimV